MWTHLARLEKRDADRQDGGEEPEVRSEDDVAGWTWKFSKSPLGSGEFLLVKQGTEEVKMVVRTINSAAFTQHDWDEYVVTASLPSSSLYTSTS